jgi:hypothetical protein
MRPSFLVLGLALIAIAAFFASGCELAVKLDRSQADTGGDAGCTICTFDDGGDDGGDDASNAQEDASADSGTSDAGVPIDATLVDSSATGG